MPAGCLCCVGARKRELELPPVGQRAQPREAALGGEKRWHQESVQVREGSGYSANKYADDCLTSTVTSTPKTGTSRHEHIQLGQRDRREDVVFKLESQC